MSFDVKDSLGNNLLPGDVVIFGERWGSVDIGVIFDKVKRDGYADKVRVKAPSNKGKTTPWGNTRVKSFSVYRGYCSEIIKMGTAATKLKIGNATILSNYMAETNKIIIEEKAEAVEVKNPGSLEDLLSNLGAPKI